MLINDMPRADLEVAAIENNIIPMDTAEQCAAVNAMTTEELRAAVLAWVEANNETA